MEGFLCGLISRVFANQFVDCGLNLKSHTITHYQKYGPQNAGDPERGLFPMVPCLKGLTVHKDLVMFLWKLPRP
jgi:hypothetical protein